MDSSTDSAKASLNSSNTFERKRRTISSTIMMNSATDQKIPRASLIHPIPDEMEEFNLKNSISVTHTDNEQESNKMGHHMGDKKNSPKPTSSLQNRVQRTLETNSSRSPGVDSDLAAKMHSSMKS